MMDEQTINNIYQAFKNGQMSQQEEQEYINDIQAGKMQAPEGAVLNFSKQEQPQNIAKQQQQIVLNQGILDAYKSGLMTRDDKIAFEKDLAEGKIYVPEGFQVEKTEPMGFFEGMVEQVTGTERSTPEIESLPDWGYIPELNTFSMEGIKSAIGTILADPTEAVKVLKANFPSMGIRRDQKGNFILQSTIDGKEYAIKPGFRHTDIPRAAAGMLAFTPAGRASTLGGQVLGSAATQAAIEGSQAATGGEFNPEQIPYAGAAAGLGYAVGKGLQSGGRFLGRAYERFFTPAAESAIQKTVKEAEKIGVPVMTSDVAKPETFIGKTFQQTGERIPIAGTGGLRATQQTARKEAVKDIVKNYTSDSINLSGDIVEDLTSKRTNSINKFAKLKNDVIDSLSENNEIVELPNTIKAIDSEIDNLLNLGTESVIPVVKVLDDWKNAITNQDLRNVENIRKIIGESFKSPDLSSIKKTGEKSLNKIYAPLREDMGNFIKKYGNKKDFNKWNIANKNLANISRDIDFSSFKKVLQKGESTPEIVESMIFSKKPSEVQKLYKELSNNGREKVKESIISKIGDKSKIETEKGFSFSPEKFNLNLKKLMPQIEVFFKGSEKEQLKGLSRVLDLTRRAGESGVSTPTGQQAVPFIAASALTDLLGSSGAFLTTSGGIGLAARMFESKPVRNILLQLSKTPKNSQKESKLINQLSNILQKSYQTTKNIQEKK